MTGATVNSDRCLSALWRTVFIVCVVLGLAFVLGALLLPMLATFTATLTFGGLLFGSGVVGLIALVFDWRAKGFVWRLLWALIATLGGICIFFHPWEGAYTLTLVLAAILLAQGLVSLAHAITHRPRPACPCGWMSFGGAVTSLLGGLLIRWLPPARTSVG